MLHTFLTLLFLLFVLPNAVAAGGDVGPEPVDVRRQVQRTMALDPDAEGSERIRLEAHELPGNTGAGRAKESAEPPGPVSSEVAVPASRPDTHPTHLPVPEKTITIRSIEDVYDLDQELDDAHERARVRDRGQ